LRVVARFQLGANIIHPVRVAGGVLAGLEGVVDDPQGGIGIVLGADADPLGVGAHINAALLRAQGVGQVQHCRGAQQGGIAVGEDIIHRRRLGDARQEGRLAQRQLAG